MPIVVVQAGDLVGSGFVASLAHPGGNITGFTNWEYSIGGKWFEILREIVPGLAKVITISNPSNLASTSLHSREIEDGAHKAGIQFTAVSIRKTTDFNDAIERLAQVTKLPPSLRAGMERDPDYELPDQRNDWFVEPLLTPFEVASILRLSPVSVRRLPIPSISLAGELRYRQSELRRYLAQQESVGKNRYV